MASQYVEGPEAKGMETGFALDELLRKERGDTARTMFNAGAQRQHQQAQIQAAKDAASQSQQFELQKMLKGEELKEQYAQKQADQGAPAIQALMAGNPDVAKIFGYSAGQPAAIQRQGAMAEPEAAGIPASISPAVPQRMPTTAEAAGLGRAMPGMAQALLNRQLDPNAGFTLSPGQRRFDSQGQEIARGGPADVGMTLEEATRVKEHLEKIDPTNVGRVQLQSHEKGGWTVSLASQTPLTPPDPIKQGYWDRLKMGVPANVALEWYTAKQAEAAGQKQLSISVNTPPTEAALQGDEKTRVTLQALDTLKGTNDVAPQMVREFLTWKGSAAELYNKLNRIPGMQYLVGPQGLDQEQFIQRYNDWSANMGQIRAGSFDMGGKQLTPFEDSVVRMTIPTTADSPEAYTAKINWLSSYKGAQQNYVTWARVTPKGAQTAEAQAQAWTNAKQQAGIDTAKSADYRRFMSPDDRLREKLR